MMITEEGVESDIDDVLKRVLAFYSRFVLY